MVGTSTAIQQSHFAEPLRWLGQPDESFLPLRVDRAEAYGAIEHRVQAIVGVTALKQQFAGSKGDDTGACAKRLLQGRRQVREPMAGGEHPALQGAQFGG
jgi:hypothetical protein